jgi:hypothetical protein
MIFTIQGHKNVLSTHKNTIEFTKDSELTLRGDCILGVNADFDYSELMELVKKFSKIKVVINVGDLQEELIAFINKKFDDEHEIVIRKTDFLSKRTLGTKADKAAIDLDRMLVEKLKNPNTNGKVEIIGL